MMDIQFIAWGSYDMGKPRVRMLLDALRKRGRLVSQIHIDVWSGIEDKSIAAPFAILRALTRLIIGYPAALARVAMTPRDRVVLLLYPAIIDMLVLWPLARLRGQTVIFDAFISFHDTIVSDRKRLKSTSVRARLLWHIERLALTLADMILVDTDEHGIFFATSFKLPCTKFVTVPVGAEPLFWDSRDHSANDRLPKDLPARYALFYGQFIPLHGVDTILAAAAATEDEAVHWLIIGSGQEDHLVRDFVERQPKNLTWLPWMDYEQLPNFIRNATVSLGIFGISDKAARVLPNKMFQILAAGGSIITRDSPAAARLADLFPDTIKLVPPGNASALAGAIMNAFARPSRIAIPLSAREMLSPLAGIDTLIQTLNQSEKGRKCPQ